MYAYQSDRFVARENMTSVYDVASVSDLSEMAYRHFMNCEDEILYLLDGNSLAGVLSIGDLERFYTDGKGGLQINRTYTSISTLDYDKAAAFFENADTINEIPVVKEQGDFLGVIRREKTQALRKRQRRMLKAAKQGEYAWRRGEVRRFVEETRAAVFLYTYSGEKAMGQLEWKERQKIKRRAFQMDHDTKWKALSDQEWKKFLNSEKDHAADTLRQEREECRPVLVNGRAVFPDRKGDYYTIRNGYRITPNQPSGADRRIFMFGPCLVFGAYCKDDQTIEAYLQELLNTNGHTSWKVFNRGVCGGEFCYDQMFLEELSSDDLVIIVGTELFLPAKTGRKSVFRGDLSEVFPQIPHLADCVLDTVSHCNGIVNEKLAQKIYTDICSAGILQEPKKPDLPEKLQDYYINWSVREYFTGYFQRYGLVKEQDETKVGAIVMNCNPFTKGHRYLIERALEVADRLYLFVVEEEQSYFKFQDRFRMVERGVSDLHNVRVIPSGRYMISLDTFAQYFEKEQVQTVDSMDYDVHIFGEIVARALGIQVRFVGEEPLDEVTRTYNETMKRILPDYGVEVVEFPRTSFAEEGIISATLVRKAIREGDMDRVEKLCPESTVKYLRWKVKV